MTGLSATFLQDMSAKKSFFGKLLALFLATVTSMFLFLSMKLMITSQQYKIEEALGGAAIDFIRVAREEDTNLKERAKRPSRQEAEPPPPPPQLDSVARPDIDPSSLAESNFDLELGLNLDVPVDGDALAIVRVLPRYPNRALQRNIEGWVLLEFTINEVGLAKNIKIVESEPSGTFDRAAMNAVKKWKYKPKTEEGRSVPRAGVRQMISFNIAKE